MEYSTRASYTDKETAKNALERSLKELEGFPGKGNVSFSISLSESESNNTAEEKRYAELGKLAVDVAHFVPLLVQDKEEKALVEPFLKKFHSVTGRFLGTPRVLSSLAKEAAKKK